MVGAVAAAAVVVVAASASAVASGSWDVRAAVARARPESRRGSARNDAASVPLVEAYAPGVSVMFVLLFHGCNRRARPGARDVMRCDMSIGARCGGNKKNDFV